MTDFKLSSINIVLNDHCLIPWDHVYRDFTVYVQIFEGRKFCGFHGKLAIHEFFILENSG